MADHAQIGDTVTALHPESQEWQEGKVDGFANDPDTGEPQALIRVAFFPSPTGPAGSHDVSKKFVLKK